MERLRFSSSCPRSTGYEHTFDVGFHRGPVSVSGRVGSDPLGVHNGVQQASVGRGEVWLVAVGNFIASELPKQ